MGSFLSAFTPTLFTGCLVSLGIQIKCLLNRNHDPSTNPPSWAFLPFPPQAIGGCYHNFMLPFMRLWSNRSLAVQSSDGSGTLKSAAARFDWSVCVIAYDMICWTGWTCTPCQKRMSIKIHHASWLCFISFFVRSNRLDYRAFFFFLRVRPEDRRANGRKDKHQRSLAAGGRRNLFITVFGLWNGYLISGWDLSLSGAQSTAVTSTINL